MAKSFTQSDRREGLINLILNLLAIKERSTQDLVAALDVSECSIANYCRELKRRGLVSDRRLKTAGHPLVWSMVKTDKPVARRYLMDDPRRLEIQKTIARSQGIPRRQFGIQSGMGMFNQV